MAEDTDGTEARLRAIADALGMPVERLYDERSEYFDGSQECLRLWSRIRTPDGRRQALECIRRVVDDQAG